MADQSVLDNTLGSTAVPTNPQEIALHSLCKQLLKSRLFRGFYLERRYVENVKAYRDLVSLQKSEKSLNKMLIDIRDKLQMFYTHQNPQMWIGITSGTSNGITTHQHASVETYLWVEINDLAFGQYWFSIKTIRFRDNEIILKIKEVQPVEEEVISKWTPSVASNKSVSDKNKDYLEKSTDSLQTVPTFDDYMLLLKQWSESIKQTIYGFIAEDISKENIKGMLRFMCLLVLSILSGAILAVKFLGEFTLRFIFEISRLTHVLTPIILKLIEVFNKIIGGFYILLAMIWKDAVVNRNQPKYNAVEYHRPMYRSIQYEEKQGRSGSLLASAHSSNDRSCQ